MLQHFSYKGSVIQQRGDGFVNLTQMCQANGKRLDSWMRSKSAVADIERIERLHPGLKVLETKEGVGGGTWGHPDLAKCLSQWLEKNQSKNRSILGCIYVYLDEGNSAYKIGFSADIKKREKQHKASNPFLSLVFLCEGCTIEDEAMVHEKLLHYRVSGTTEWYRKHPDVLRITKLLLSDKEG